MFTEELRGGWLVQFILTMGVVVFGVFLIKRGAFALYRYYAARQTPGTEPLTCILILGIAQAAVGVLLIVSFFMSSPYALNVFASG